MSKFVCGDLVTLSSAGRKSDQNHIVYGLIGIIMKQRLFTKGCNLIKDLHPIKVKWIGLNNRGHDGADMFPMKEYEIKFAKHGVVEKTLPNDHYKH